MQASYELFNSYSSNSNAQRTTVKVKSSYTFGAMPTQRNDLTVSVDEEQFLMEFADSNNIYTLHVRY